MVTNTFKKFAKIIALPCLCVLLCGCMIGRPANVMGKFQLCDTCKEFVVGKWYTIHDGKLFTMEYREDGTRVGSDDNRWNCACKNGDHAIRIGGDNYSLGLTSYDPETGGFEGWQKDKGYTFVELTQDNWKDYFQADPSQLFDIRCVLESAEKTDEWGDVTTTYTLTKYAVLKNSEKYGPLTSFMLELDIANVVTQITIDSQKKEVLDNQVTHLEEKILMTKTAVWDDALGVVIPLGQVNTDTLEEIVHLNTEELGDTIYRIKGVLVLK